MPDDQKAYIFPPFTQLSTGFSRVEGGVGLGLYIALAVSDAVQRIREAAPDLMFLDLHMPGTSGWDALREARDAISALPPIIVLTADTRTDSMREASAAGVAGSLPKPINAHELLALLAQHASHARP